MTIADLSAGQLGHIALHKAIRGRLASVREYGAVGDGVTDDTTAIQAAIDSGMVYLPRGIYKVGSLNFTKARGLIVDGEHKTGSVLLLSTDGAVGLDMLGANAVRISNLTIRGDVNNPPNVGVFLGRSTQSNGGECYFDNIIFDGVYGLGCIANHSSELNTYTNIRMQLYQSPGMQFAYYFSGLNDWDITSQFATNADVASMCSSWLSRLVVMCPANSEMVPFWLGHKANGFYLGDSYFYAATAPCVVRMTGEQHISTVFRGLFVEGTPDDFLHLAPEVVASSLEFDRVSCSAATRSPIYAEDGASVDNLSIVCCRMTPAYMRFYDLNRADIRYWAANPGEIGGIEVARNLRYSNIIANRGGVTIGGLSVGNTVVNPYEA